MNYDDSNLEAQISLRRILEEPIITIARLDEVQINITRVNMDYDVFIMRYWGERDYEYLELLDGWLVCGEQLLLVKKNKDGDSL